MRPLDELLSAQDEGWQFVRALIGRSPRTVEIVPPAQAGRVLRQLQVTTRSPLGALAWHTGGLLLDHRWLRLLGGDNTASLPTISEASNIDPGGPSDPPQFLIIGHDIAGGRFAINGGGLPGALGQIAYFAPDTLEWESLEMTHSEFLGWALTGDTAGFFSALRWPGWEHDAEAVPLDSGVSFYPFLWTTEGKDVAATRRNVVPLTEVVSASDDFARQLRDIPPGRAFDVNASP